MDDVIINFENSLTPENVSSKSQPRLHDGFQSGS